MKRKYKKEYNDKYGSISVKIDKEVCENFKFVAA